MLVWVLSATFVAGQTVYRVNRGSVREYKIDKPAVVVSYSWQIFTDLSFISQANSTQAELIPLGVGRENEIQVNWHLAGEYYLLVTVNDATGCNNRMAWHFIVDPTVPVIPTVISQITNIHTPVISGTATVGVGETFTVAVNGKTYTNGDGHLTLTGTNWALQIPAGNEIVDGTYPVTATVTDLAGNTSTDVTTNELIIDSTAPAIPTVISQITNDHTPVISGTATVGAGETFTVTVNGKTYTA